jgi:hypothetical protein
VAGDCNNQTRWSPSPPSVVPQIPAASAPFFHW